MNNPYRHRFLSCGAWGGLLVWALASTALADAPRPAEDPAGPAQGTNESGHAEEDVSWSDDSRQERALTTSSFFSGGFEFGGGVGDPAATMPGGGPSELSSVLVLPSGDSDPNKIRALREDLAVMAEILDDHVRPLLIRTDTLAGYGIASAGQNAINRCTYLEGYGALFVLQVDFPLTWRPGYERIARGPGRHDLVWETARARVVGARQVQGGAEAVFDADRVARLKKSLLEALVHAVNLRGVTDGEWVIVAVQSVPEPSGQTGFSYFYRRYTYGVSGGVSQGRHDGPSVLSLRVKKGDIAPFAEGGIREEVFAQGVMVVVY